MTEHVGLNGSACICEVRLSTAHSSLPMHCSSSDSIVSTQTLKVSIPPVEVWLELFAHLVSHCFQHIGQCIVQLHVHVVDPKVQFGQLSEDPLYGLRKAQHGRSNFWILV